jgi:uncharacterized protein (TIGR02594 family)
MPQFKTLIDTNLLKEPSRTAEALAPIAKGTVYSGMPDGNFVKTRIPSVHSDEGFVRIRDVSQELVVPEPLTPDGFVSFGGLVTWASREVGANRDYLMAVAYDSSKNLTALGGPDTPKAGPFQFSAEVWQAALSGVAASVDFSPKDRLDWGHQPTIAAFLAKDATEKFKKKFDRLPTFRELYFLQLVGDDALNALETPTKLCSEAIPGNPTLGTYAAELKVGTLTVDAALKDLQTRLEAAYAEALKVIDKLRPEDRLMRASVGDPPWMAVAREEMAKGIKEDPGDRNTEEISAYFKAINAHVGTIPGQTVHWCGAFVGYCIKTCGVSAAANKVAPEAVGADYWLTWDKAPDPPPVGAIVVFPGEHVGFLAEGSTATKLKILGGNQSDSVSIATRDRAGAQFRWFAGIPRVSAPAIPAGQNAFVTLAPQIMKKLLGDFPEAELNEMHLAAILGNLGHECAGFTVFIEQHPIHVGLPGIGWAQWTFDRGDKFRARLGGKSPGDFDTNYEFLREELKGSHKRAISAMKTATDLFGAVKEFERIFEVAHPDFKRYKERMDYAQIALSAFKGA